LAIKVCGRRRFGDLGGWRLGYCGVGVCDATGGAVGKTWELAWRLERRCWGAICGCKGAAGDGLCCKRWAGVRIGWRDSLFWLVNAFFVEYVINLLLD